MTEELSMTYDELCKDIKLSFEEMLFDDFITYIADHFVDMQNLKRRNEELEKVVVDLSQDETAESLYEKSKMLPMLELVGLYNKFRADLEELNAIYNTKKSLYQKIVEYKKK